jgi:hypothetical protein
MTSWKRLTLAIVITGALMIVGLSPTSAVADRRHGHAHYGHGHHGHRHHSHWHHRPYLAGPPVVLRGSYYPVQYYYAPPYWYDYGYISPYYGGGIYYYGW